MLRVLYADFRRLFQDKLFYLGTVGYAFLYVAAIPLVVVVLSRLLKMPVGYGDGDLTGYAGTAAIGIAIFASTCLARDFMEGTVKNKLIAGIRRRDVFLSSLIINVFVAVCFQIISMASILLVGNLFMLGFETPFQTILEMNLIYLLAVVAIAIFNVTIAFVFGGNKITLYLGAGIAIGMKLLSSMVLQDLYPSQGERVITGFRLSLFCFLDRYLPFFHLYGFPRYDWNSYLIGAATLSAVSVLAGLVIFQKRDLK